MSPLELNCGPGGGRLEATTKCSRLRGRGDLTLRSSHTTNVCEAGIVVAASDAACSDRPAAGLRFEGASSGSLSGGPANGPMFAARAGPDRRASTRRVRASRTSKPSTARVYGWLLVSSTS